MKPNHTFFTGEGAGRKEVRNPSEQCTKTTFANICIFSIDLKLSCYWFNISSIANYTALSVTNLISLSGHIWDGPFKRHASKCNCYCIVENFGCCGK